MNELSRRQVLRSMAAVGATAAVPSWLGACAACPERTNFVWNNALQLDGVDPRAVLVPDHLEHLIEVVRAAEREGRRVRMTGAGHSFSDVALSDDYLLTPQGLSLPLTLDQSELRADCRPETLVRVQSGIQLWQLNDWLWHEQQPGLALSNLGGYDAQTIVGAAMTGTHGSGLKHGPIASQIVSLQIVSVGGEVIQLEPTHGITDASRFKGRVALHDEPMTIAGNTHGNSGAAPSVAVRLIQDDALFNAVSVSMGCMGIVYAVVLRVEPRYWLKEYRLLTTWGAVSQPDGFLDRVMHGRKIDDGDGPDPEHYEVYVNPYPSKPGDAPAKHHCILTKRYKLTRQPSRDHEQRTRGTVANWLLKLANKVSGNGGGIATFLNDHPNKAGWVIDESLKAIEDKGGYIGRGYQVFNLGEPNHVRAYGIEMAFDLSQSIEAIERVFVHAKQLRDDEQCVHSSPATLRFVKASDAPLAMQHGRATTMLEMGMLVCANGSHDLLDSYERMFMDKMNARPHWGLDLNVLEGLSEVRRLYGDEPVDAWLAAYRTLNPHGTFSGRFTDRLKLDE